MGEHMKLPKIAVLLAVYNGNEWLREQLNSILNQEVVDVTILISIDQSNDGSENLCYEFSSQLQNVILLPNAGQFGGAAQNFFRLIRDVDFSDYDYIALADQDDIWQQDKLLRAIEMLAISKADAYSSNVIAFWPDGKRKLIKKSQTQQKWDYMFESAGPGCTFVFTKMLALVVQKVLVKHQIACQSVALHDWFIYALAKSCGHQWFIDDEPHMFYRQHAGNVVGANVGVKAKLVRWRKLREGWLFKQALQMAKILDYSHEWPIQKLKRYHLLDRLALVINVSKLRRRLRDRVAFVLFLLQPFNK